MIFYTYPSGIGVMIVFLFYPSSKHRKASDARSLPHKEGAKETETADTKGGTKRGSGESPSGTDASTRTQR